VISAMSGKYTLPMYEQLSNCCGISTFLMLINPEKNNEFKAFLDNTYEKISFLNKQTRKEFKWSVVIDYILLKSIGNNLLKKFLNERVPDIVNYYMPIIHFKLKDKKFSNNNVVTRRILKKSLHTMREDTDLKILFNLFGGNYFPQEQETYDPTRALYFTSKDFFPNDSGLNKKLDLIKNHLLSENNSNIPCIALNFGYHWVAVNSIENDILGINNPLGSSPSRKQITHRIPENYRFYLFNYNQKKSFILKKEIKNFFESEIEKELV